MTIHWKLIWSLCLNKCKDQNRHEKISMYSSIQSVIHWCIRQILTDSLLLASLRAQFWGHSGEKLVQFLLPDLFFLHQVGKMDIKLAKPKTNKQTNKQTKKTKTKQNQKQKLNPKCNDLIIGKMHLFVCRRILLTSQVWISECGCPVHLLFSSRNVPISYLAT